MILLAAGAFNIQIYRRVCTWIVSDLDQVVPERTVQDDIRHRRKERMFPITRE
jgi:hypothetical protein